MQFQIHWGNDQGTELKSGITDVRNPNSNALGYMGPDAWGLGRFMAQGNLPPAAQGGTGRAAGHVPVKFSVAKDGKVSLSIVDTQGKTVRTGFGAVPYKAGEYTWLWDGLDDRDNPLPAGTYTAKILTHDGIGQKYICNVGVSGEPPYQTEDGTGGWAGDYWEPMYVAIEGDRVIMGTGCAEAQKPTIATNLEGRKQWGSAAIGHSLALHKGFGYFVVWASNGNLVKFDQATGQLKPFANGQPEVKAPGRGARRGLVVLDDTTLVMSSDDENKLYLIDLTTGEVKGEVALPAPKGLAVDGKGTIYAVSGSSVGRVDIKTGEFIPLATELNEPKMLACDAAGNVYVSLQGQTMQVWKLDPAGKIGRKFGTVGGRPALGKFDSVGMIKPYAIAVDKNNRLWVCENDREPKRYSVWNADGSLWKEFFGSLPYSTAGYFDPKNPEYFYAMNVRYQVDYDKGTWKPDATILREREDAGVKLAPVSAHGGGKIIVHQGRKFLFMGGGLAPDVNLYEEVDGQWVPRLAKYVSQISVPGPIGKDGKPGKPRVTKISSLWLDANNDGQVQPDECAPIGTRLGSTGHIDIDQGLNIYTYTGDGWTEPRAEGRRTPPFSILKLDFLGFSPDGRLRYAGESRPVVVAETDGGSVNGLAVEPDGSALYVLLSGGLVARGERAQATGARVAKYSADGKEIWRYANVHVGFAWTSSTYTPGFVVAAFRCSNATHPDLLPVTGYYGQYFLLDKQTGLFVDALCQDQRSAYKLDYSMVLTENFNGNIFKHPGTGKSYFTGGDCDCRIWELTGLESLKRQNVIVNLSDEQATQAVKNSEQNKQAQLALLQRNSGRKSAGLKQLVNAAPDGQDAEWQGVAVLPIGDDQTKPAQVQLGYDDKNLYARFQVMTATPFLNTPTDPKLLFKSGSALEICITPSLDQRKVGPNNRHPMLIGDLRVLIARTTDGKLIATRYRPKIKEAKKPSAVYFETPSAGREEFDEIAGWNDLPMNYREIKGGYIVEVAVPWDATALKPTAGLKFLFDAGVIYGNEGGTRNAARALWSDRTPEIGVNNDIPTESRLHPNGWGLVVVE
jgi:DNA-binding beta-propeller fold protein YncE